jgi:hypothetical protein
MRSSHTGRRGQLRCCASSSARSGWNSSRRTSDGPSTERSQASTRSP